MIVFDLYSHIRLNQPAGKGVYFVHTKYFQNMWKPKQIVSCALFIITSNLVLNQAS